MGGRFNAPVASTSGPACYRRKRISPPDMNRTNPIILLHSPAGERARRSTQAHNIAAHEFKRCGRIKPAGNQLARLGAGVVRNW